MPEIDLLGTYWENKFISNVLGGIRLDTNSESMDSSQFLQLFNLIYENGDLRKDSGYKDFANVVLGTPRLVFQHITAGGSTNTFLVTNLSFYKQSGLFWHIVSVGVATVTDVDVNGGSVVIPVAVTTYISASNPVGILLIAGLHHVSTFAL